MSIVSDSTNSAQPTVGHPVPATTVVDAIMARLATEMPGFTKGETTLGGLREALTEAVGTITQPHAPGLLTEAQTTLVPDFGLGARRTKPIETALRNIDTDGMDNEDVPWLAAELVVSNDKLQAYGRTTKVWTHYGVHTGELTPAQGREALAALRDFTDRYEALLDIADRSAAEDFEGDPEIARLDIEATDRRIDGISSASVLNRLVAEHDAELLEWDTATLDPKLRDHFVASRTERPGHGPTVVVPLGQHPVERLAAVQALLTGAKADHA